ncbi:MAG TPA: UDP-N-acetylglucosamine 2-epimerase (non-hydrolyzing) [Ruminococcaceae bacterium]|nr:UDP-N-acetylglucosamine 2-epimerase (non-hydrolyzing) [Oscillospiraceae bacterium]
MKTMLVFGTRPEAVKMCPLVKVLTQMDAFQVQVAVTGQHREMLDQVLHTFQVKPDVDMHVMHARQTLSEITANVLAGTEQAIHNLQPDIVLVHGDTTTTLAGALAAFYAQVPVGHVEAGLRSFDLQSPFPEEMNRRLTDVLSALHFAPTVRNRENLERENNTGHIYVTGNTVIDALRTTVEKTYLFHEENLRRLDFSRRTILLTAHRRENIGKPLEQICQAVLKIVEAVPDIQVVYPVHLNPAIRETVFHLLGGHSRIFLIDPLDVEDMHNLIARSFFVMTDSGGLQEETPALGKPVLVLRTETERPEAVEAGTVAMAGVERERIVKLAMALLTEPSTYQKMAHAVNPYGDGKASKRIAQAILHYFGKAKAPADFRVL